MTASSYFITATFGIIIGAGLNFGCHVRNYQAKGLEHPVYDSDGVEHRILAVEFTGDGLTSGDQQIGAGPRSRTAVVDPEGRVIPFAEVKNAGQTRWRGELKRQNLLTSDGKYLGGPAWPDSPKGFPAPRGLTLQVSEAEARRLRGK